MKLNRRIEVELVGRGKAALGPNDHLATGGEASVYRLAGSVIKLYTDPSKMRQVGMIEKLDILASFAHPDIVAPRGLVLDKRGEPLGYYMDFVDGGEALSRVFTNDFRKRAGFGDPGALHLVDRMFKVLEFAHGHNATMVDPNELNWTTVGSKGGKRDPRVLDVDSWLAGSHRPPTIPMMPSIRDWHSQGVGRESDRFALGVVTFQVFVGIHPYKGSLDGYKPNELPRRMQENASVFSRGVRLNQAVRDFSCIPGPLLGWYEATFQHGERSMPPSPYATGVTAPSRRVKVARVVTTSSGSLNYKRLFDVPGDSITRVFHCGVVQTESGKLIDVASKRTLSQDAPGDCEVVKADGGWVIAKPGERPEFSFVNEINLASTPLSANVEARGLVRYQNRLFAVTDRGLAELTLKQFARPILAVGQLWQTTVNSTRWFDGVGVLDTMGATYLIAPFGADSCAQTRVRELDGLHVVAAKAGPRFVSVIVIDAKGEYRKMEFTFDRQYSTSYTVWKGDAESPELNMALLPRGVMATVVRDGQLVIFVPTSGNVTRADDKDVKTDMLLGNWEDRVVYIRDGQLWHVSMRS
jgi:hypothetical protein